MPFPFARPSVKIVGRPPVAARRFPLVQTLWANVLGICTSVVMSAGFAQSLDIHPEQEILRQQERERALRERLEPDPNVRLESPTQTPAAAARLQRNETPCFVIGTLRLAGDSAEQFQWALAAANPTGDEAMGACLGVNAINQVMARVQNAVLAQGYVTTRILAAPQDLTQGTLTLTVVPGKVRRIRYQEDSYGRGFHHNALPLRAGDILNLRAIEQGLENLKRVPTADADIQITPSDDTLAAPGDSDLVISWRQTVPYRLSFSLDDGGSRSTGTYQGSVSFSMDHPLMLNDLFYASLNTDLGGGDAGRRGTRGHTLHYSVPYDYWLFSFTNSAYDYHQSVAGLNQAYVYSGKNKNNEFKVSRLLYRDAVRKSGIYARAWMRESSNAIDDTEIDVQYRRMAGWEAGITHREYLGSASLDTTLSYRRGTGAWGSVAAPEESFGEGTSRLQLSSLELQFTQPFSVGQQRFYYSGTARGQWNHTPLVPQDRFSIGGRYSVRGFDGESALTGDRGGLIRNEVVALLGDSGQELYLGADYGRVGGPSSKWLLGRKLAGGVIGLRSRYRGAYLDVFAGKPFSKPSGFRTADTTYGFNFSLSL